MHNKLAFNLLSVRAIAFYCALSGLLVTESAPSLAQSGSRSSGSRQRSAPTLNQAPISNQGSANRSSASRQRPAASANQGSATKAPTLVAEPLQKLGSPFVPPKNLDIRLPVAIRGFCAVKLRDQQKWVAGQEQNQVVFDGHLYWFASQRERAKFAANPLRYVPVLGGDSVVALVDADKRAAGDPRYGILHDNRLFFFQNDSEQQQFRTQPERYANADLANEGQCLVCRIDQERNLPGQPETTVIVNGQRYLFAGIHQQRKFLVDMGRYGVRPAIIAQRAAIKPEPPLTPMIAKIKAKTQQSTVKPLPKKRLPGREPNIAPDSVAMSGYCPVSIHEAGIWAVGDERYEATFDGQVYLMADEAELEKFNQNPAIYIPALGGRCVVSEVDQNKFVAGNIYHAAQYENRLYLFAGAEEKSIFKANPDTYINADLAADGNCIVSEIDKQQTVAGLPELMTWHRGRRYFFASPENLTTFLENTQRYQER